MRPYTSHSTSIVFREMLTTNYNLSCYVKVVFFPVPYPLSGYNIRSGIFCQQLQTAHVHRGLLYIDRVSCWMLCFHPTQMVFSKTFKETNHTDAV